MLYQLHSTNNNNNNNKNNNDNLKNFHCFHNPFECVKLFIDMPAGTVSAVGLLSDYQGFGVFSDSQNSTVSAYLLLYNKKSLIMITKIQHGRHFC